MPPHHVGNQPSIGGQARVPAQLGCPGNKGGARVEPDIRQRAEESRCNAPQKAGGKLPAYRAGAPAACLSTVCLLTAGAPALAQPARDAEESHREHAGTHARQDPRTKHGDGCTPPGEQGDNGPDGYGEPHDRGRGHADPDPRHPLRIGEGGHPPPRAAQHRNHELPGRHPREDPRPGGEEE